MKFVWNVKSRDVKRTSVRIAVLLCVLGLGLGVLSSRAYGGNPSNKKVKDKDTESTPVAQTMTAENMRVQGEQRFRANCSRCHAAPQKFPPRMMATVLRHMRVRATITDADMRLVLFYMTQ